MRLMRAAIAATIGMWFACEADAQIRTYAPSDVHVRDYWQNDGSNRVDWAAVRAQVAAGARRIVLEPVLPSMVAVQPGQKPPEGVSYLLDSPLVVTQPVEIVGIGQPRVNVVGAGRFWLNGAGGARIEGVTFEGAGWKPPQTAILVSRRPDGQRFASCNFVTLDRVNVEGHFTVAAAVFLANELDGVTNCRFANAAPDLPACIVGSDDCWSLGAPSGHVDLTSSGHTWSNVAIHSRGGSIAPFVVRGTVTDFNPRAWVSWEQPVEAAVRIQIDPDVPGRGRAPQRVNFGQVQVEGPEAPKVRIVP